MDVVVIQDIDDGGIIAVAKDYKEAVEYLFKWNYIDPEEEYWLDFSKYQVLSEYFKDIDPKEEMLTWDIPTFNRFWCQEFYLELCRVRGI